MILVTGSSGLIGRYLCRRFDRLRIDYRALDLRASTTQDIRNSDTIKSALDGVSGVVHLAAISRVIWGEQDPIGCITTNVQALRALLSQCLENRRTWFIFVSSREVYGNACRLPVHEDTPLCPVNVYGRTKHAGELLVLKARAAGLVANICRLSNVFGCPLDHEDRVAPAFARAAARGGSIVVEGGENTFDFTAVEAVVDGLSRLVDVTSGGELLPPIHLVSGVGTTLRELAQIAALNARHPVSLTEGPPRTFDVQSFIGDPGRARELLGWAHSMSVADRMAALIADLSSR